ARCPPPLAYRFAGKIDRGIHALERARFEIASFWIPPNPARADRPCANDTHDLVAPRLKRTHECGPDEAARTGDRDLHTLTLTARTRFCPSATPRYDRGHDRDRSASRRHH